MKDTFYLFKSDKPTKKWVMLMGKYNHLHYFGSSSHRDFTLMSKKTSKYYEPDTVNREKIRQRYIKRHAKEPKGVHTRSSLADLILWSEPTVAGGVREYEKKFGVNVVISNKKLTSKKRKEIMGVGR